MSSLQENPWATGSTYVSVGGLQRALRLAENASYKGLLIDDSDQRGRMGDGVENCASLVLIKSLKKISSLDERFNKLQQEIQWITTLSSTADLTDTESLNSLLSLLEDLCNHLQLIMDKKDNLAARLHEAYDDHMVIDADYHRDVAECFPDLAKQLGSLSSNIDSILWTHKFSMKDCNLNIVFSKLSSRLAEIQSFYQTLTESRSLMTSRIRQHSKLQESSYNQKKA